MEAKGDQLVHEVRSLFPHAYSLVMSFFSCGVEIERTSTHRGFLLFGGLRTMLTCYLSPHHYSLFTNAPCRLSKP